MEEVGRDGPHARLRGAAHGGRGGVNLTSLSQKDAGIKPQDCREEEGGKEGEEVPHDNPFQTPVSMLLYRLARNILETGDRSEEEGTVRELLQNCLALFDSEKLPHIATSAHFLLSELYVPEGTDPTHPGFGTKEEEDTSEEQSEEEEGEQQASVGVSTLCLPTPALGDLWGEAFRSPPISATVSDRCHSALRHLAQGLAFLSSLKARREARARQELKEREMEDWSVITMRNQKTRRYRR